MPQVLFPENIKTLAVATTTTMTQAASIVNIGGQQFISTSTVTLDFGTTGVNGLDTGSIAAGTTYNVFAVPDAGALGLVASTASTPSGFTSYKLIGTARTKSYQAELEGGILSSETTSTIEVDKVSIGTVGAVANEQGSIDDTFLTGLGFSLANVAGFDFDADFTKDSGTGTVTFASSSADVPVFDSKGLFGRETAMRFPTASSQLESTDAFAKPGDVDFGYVGWFKVPEGGNKSLFGAWESGQENTLMRADTTNNIEWFVGGSTSLLIPNFPWDQKVHVAVTYDSATDTNSVYLNGELAGTDVQASTVTTSDFHVGERSSGGQNANQVTVEDFLIFNGVTPTADQVRQLYSRRFTNTPQLAGGHVLDADSFPMADLTDKVYFWSLDNSEADGSGNDATLVKGAGTLYDGGGILGGETSPNFGGTSTDFFDVPTTAAINNATTWSTGGWFRVNWQSSSSTNNALITKAVFSTGGASDRTFQILSNNTGILQVEVRGAAGTASLAPDIDFIDGSWHHIALTFDSEFNAKLYLDGVLAASDNAGGVCYTNSTPLKIGNREVANTLPIEHNGSAREVFFGTKVLTGEDIRKLASSRVDLSTPTAPEDQVWSGTVESEDGQTKSKLHIGDDVSREVEKVVNFEADLHSTTGVGNRKGWYKRSGNVMLGHVDISYIGGASSGEYRIKIPEGLTIDDRWGFFNDGTTSLGSGVFFDVGTNWTTLNLIYSNTNEIAMVQDGSGSRFNSSGKAAGDFVSIDFKIPIREWADESEARATIVDQKSDKIYVDTAGNPGDRITMKLKKG